jgi:hypothetical protein
MKKPALLALGPVAAARRSTSSAKWYVVSRNGSKIDTDGH